jgi:mannobiose 2-epimerase
MMSDLSQLSDQMLAELQEHILPYWLSNTIDATNGGFYGRIDGDNNIILDASKGVILNTRILWTFSASYRQLGNAEYLEIADRAYKYLIDYFWDNEYGGLYWMLNADGTVLNSKKHAYAQAFGIYAFSEYYRASGMDDSLQQAIALFKILDKQSYQTSSNAYLEAFDREWNPLLDVRLSAIDAPEERSTNTHLHILEAYTNLFRCWPNEILSIRLEDLVEVFYDHIFDGDLAHYHAFFDSNWKPKGPTYSYGHDIEASWLLSDAVAVLNASHLSQRNKIALNSIAYSTLNEGRDSNDGGIYNLGSNGAVVDKDKHWWAQAEAIVGFVNAYQETGDSSFLEASLHSWQFINTRIIDHNDGEWFFRVDEKGIPYRHEDKVGPWKCPYHTTRACLEISQRYKSMQNNPELTHV